MAGLGKKKVSHRACLSFSGTAAIAPIIAAVKDGKSITYEGREVRALVSVILKQQMGCGHGAELLSGFSLQAPL